jgi:hypothetical protein
VTYPAVLLDVDVELKVGSGGTTWVNITPHVSRAGSDRVTIARGRQGPRSTVTPTTCAFTLLDPDGRYSPRNPNGLYYGILTRNTEVRVIVNAGAGAVTRFHGEIGSLPQTWVQSGALVRVAVQAAGIMRRLGQGDAPLPSALTRGVIDDITLIGDGVYWPMEDGEEAFSAASAYGDGEPLLPFGYAQPLFGRVDGPPGGGRAPDFSALGGLVAGVPPRITHTGEWQFELWFRTQTGDSTAFTTVVPLQVDFEGGTITAFDIILSIGAGTGGAGVGTISVDVAGYTGTPAGPGNRSGTLTLVSTGLPNVQGTWRNIEVTFTQTVPGTVTLGASLDGGSTSLGSVAVGSHTLGRPSRVAVNPCQDAPNADAYADAGGVGISSIGHLAIKNAATFGIVYPAGLGWDGEVSRARVERLCDEQAVPATVPIAASQIMGPQRIDTLLGLLRQVEAVDSGILYETRDALELAYRPSGDFYNQAAALTLNYTTRGHIADLDLVDDDLTIRNKVTITRVGGGQRTASRDTGALSTQPPPAGVGIYDEALSLPCWTDDQAGHLAGWRVHLGTWDEPRIQSLRLYMHTLATAPSGAALLAAALAVDIGDRIVITNLPAWTQRSASVLTQRYVEVIGETDWIITHTTSPEGPYQVAVIESTTLGRLDHDAATINTSVLSTASTISVATTGGLWRTTTTFPFQVTASGVIWNVTAISGASSPQTFTVNLANGITKTVPAGSRLSLATPARLAQ